MVEEVNNILDGLQDSEVEASDLRDEEVSVGYEDQEWSAEVRVDDVDGEEYVQVTYNVDSADADNISNLAQATGEDELRWGRNNGLDRKAPNIVDASEARMSIPVSRMDHSRMSAVIPEWEQELLDREYAEQIADEFGFEKDTSTHYGEWEYDVFSTDEKLSQEEVIESIVDQDESYFIQTGSDIAVKADRKLDEDTEIEETAEITAKTGEQNSATVNVYIPIENGVGIDSYSELGLSDEYRRKAEDAMENLDDYTKAMIARDSEAGGRTVRIPDSETLTQIERELGQGDQIKFSN
jgi:hypothetical protein